MLLHFIFFLHKMILHMEIHQLSAIIFSRLAETDHVRQNIFFEAPPDACNRAQIIFPVLRTARHRYTTNPGRHLFCLYPWAISNQQEFATPLPLLRRHHIHAYCNAHFSFFRCARRPHNVLPFFAEKYFARGSIDQNLCRLRKNTFHTGRLQHE